MTQPAVPESIAVTGVPVGSLGDSDGRPARLAATLWQVDRRPSQVAVAFETAHRLSADLQLTLGKLNGTRQLNRELRQELKTTRRLARSLRAQSANLRTPSVAGTAPHDLRVVPSAVGATPPRSAVAPTQRAPLTTRPVTAYADSVR